MNHKLRILPFVLAVMFASCSPVEEWHSIKNAESEYKITYINSISWLDVLKQNEDDYLVFFYSETCMHCHEIMGDVLSLAESNILKTYFLNTKESDVKIPISSDIESTVGKDSIDDIFIAGTPAIIEVKNHIVEANIAGSDDCLTLLNEKRLTK